jgi:hypothetical protein
MTDHPDDAALAAKITEAVKVVDAAVATQKERAKSAGLLLHEAHKRHPGRKAFETFLKLCDGLQYSRAMDLIAVATDRRTFEKLKADNTACQQKHRDKKKSLHKPEPKVLPKPNPEPFVRDVTDDPEASAAARKKKLPPPTLTESRITESAEVSIEQRRRENANLGMTAAEISKQNLEWFAVACREYLPKITVEMHRQEARQIVAELTSAKSKAEAA